MRSRGLVVALAVLLAAGAAAAVFMYTNGVRQEATTGGTLATVIVASKDIPTGTDLNALIDQGAFKEIQVPEDARVDGAVTSLAQLRNQSTTEPILANEQITTHRLSNGVLPGGTLGIQKGYQAVSVTLDAQQVVGDAIQRGAQVTVYAQLPDVQVIKGSIKGLINGQVSTERQDLGDFTVTVIPETRVLNIIRSGGSTEGGSSTSGNTLITLELTPDDVEKLILAQAKGTVWLALLPPGENGVSTPPIQVGTLITGKK